MLLRHIPHTLQHRPELFKAIQRSQSLKQEKSDAAIASDGVMNTGTSSSQKRGFVQFLQAKLFARRGKDTNTLPNPSLASRDTLDEDEVEASETNTPSWWQKLAHSLQGKTLACDEDPSQYDFPFSVCSAHCVV